MSLDEEQQQFQARRRGDRVSLTLLLETSGKDAQGNQFNLPSRTLLINRGGAVIVLERELVAEQQIQIKRQAPSESHRQGRAPSPNPRIAAGRGLRLRLSQ